MSDPYVRCIGAVEDLDGRGLSVGVDYDTVTVGHARLASGEAEDFAQLFAAACWAAGRNAERMEQEAAWSGPASPQTPIRAEEVNTLAEPEHDAAEEEAQADAAEPEGDDDADDSE